MNGYVGTSALARLVLRRDRVRLTIWVYAIVGLIASTAASFTSLYPTVASRLAFGHSIRSNPAFLALDGPIFNDGSIGGLTAWRFAGIAAVLASIMSVLTVVRHTRAEEESGRTELVGSGVVGRLAPLTAVLLVVGCANVLTGALVAVVLAALGTGVAGSIAFGAGVAAGGIMFAAIAAVTAQLTDGARTASGIAMAALGAAFLLRAVGDSSSRLGFFSWLSPIGWTQQVRPYADERWWVFALAAVFTVGLTAVAHALIGRRDVGAGLVPTRLGPATAAPGLRSPLALAWRLQRGSLYGWAAGFLVAGAAIGSAANSVADLLKTSKQLQDIINRLGGQSIITNTYFVATLGIYALIASAYGIQAVLRARSEETSVRAEPLLATAATRLGYIGSHLLIALAGIAVLLVAAGVGAGLAYGAVIGDMGQVPRLAGAALAQWPAAAVLAGVAAALFGCAPRLTTVAWGVLGAFALLGQIGPVLRLSQTAMDFSPYTHTPRIPGGALTAQPLLLLTLVTAVLIGAGLVGFRRRDIG